MLQAIMDLLKLNVISKRYQKTGLIDFTSQAIQRFDLLREALGQQKRYSWFPKSTAKKRWRGSAKNITFSDNIFGMC